MALFLLTNLNNKFDTSYQAERVESVIEHLRGLYPEAGFRQVGANTWQMGEPDPMTGLLVPKKYLFKHVPHEVGENAIRFPFSRER